MTHPIRPSQTHPNAKATDNVHWRWDYASDCETLFDGNGTMLAWLSKRPAYCDRGHYSGHIEICSALGMDGQDNWPNYYMDPHIAKQEIVSFLCWRLWKQIT